MIHGVSLSAMIYAVTVSSFAFAFESSCFPFNDTILYAMRYIMYLHLHSYSLGICIHFYLLSILFYDFICHHSKLSERFFIGWNWKFHKKITTNKSIILS